MMARVRKALFCSVMSVCLAVLPGPCQSVAQDVCPGTFAANLSTGELLEELVGRGLDGLDDLGLDDFLGDEG